MVTNMEYFYIIHQTMSESTSMDVFISTTFEAARAEVKNHCDWYCKQGTCKIYKVDQNFHKVKQWDYEEDKLVPGGTYWWNKDSEKVDHD